MAKEPIKLNIIKNQHEEIRIMRDGGGLKSFEANTMDADMALRYAKNLAVHLFQIEKRPVQVIDNFSTRTPCCPECGSIDVSTKVWSNFKTGSVETISSEEGDNYCNACETHTTLEDKVIDPKVGIEIFTIG